MKPEICLAALLAIPVNISGLLAQSPSQIPTIEIQQDTVIAFYTPAPMSVDPNADSNEALSDFQFYAESVQQPLGKLRIDFKVLYVRSFRLHFNGRNTEFRPKSDTAGYYLIAPGRKPLIEYGVMTDADLLLVAKRYFGLAVKQEKP